MASRFSSSSRTYMAQVAEVEVSKDGAVRVRRVVCAVDCGTVVNPDTVRAQIQGAIIFGVTAALYGEITLKDGRVEQANFDNYQTAAHERGAGHRGLHRAELRAAGRDGRSRDVGDRPCGSQRDLRCNRQAPAQAAGRYTSAEATSVSYRWHGGEAKPAGHFHEVGERGGLHLSHHVASMSLHRDFADAELATDLLVQQSGDHQRHDLPFART